MKKIYLIFGSVLAIVLIYYVAIFCYALYISNDIENKFEKLNKKLNVVDSIALVRQDSILSLLDEDEEIRNTTKLVRDSAKVLQNKIDSARANLKNQIK